MSKKVLVLTSSPRENGNTAKLADAFTRGALSVGHSVKRFDTAKMNIGGCMACNNCWSAETACCNNDDFNVIEPCLESYDVIAFITPIYWYSFPAQIKGLIDRFYAYGGSGGARPMKIRESVMIVIGEDEDGNNYESIIFQYKMMARYLGWNDLGILLRGGLGGEDAVSSTDLLNLAEEMGGKL